MTTLMLIGLILFAFVVSSELLLSRSTSAQVVYVQGSDAEGSAGYVPTLIISTLLLVILFII